MIIRQTHLKNEWRTVQCATLGCGTKIQFEQVTIGDVFRCSRCYFYNGIVVFDELNKIIKVRNIKEDELRIALNMTLLKEREQAKRELVSSERLQQIEEAWKNVVRRQFPIDLETTDKLVKSLRGVKIDFFVVACGGSNDYINTMCYEFEEAWISGNKFVFYVDGQKKIATTKYEVIKDVNGNDGQQPA